MNMSYVNAKIPMHTLSAAVIALNRKGEILLIKCPRRGWQVPGGFVEEGESLTEAAIREVKEESGYDVKITRFCGIYQYIDRPICDTLFLGEVIGGEARKSEESLDVGFFPRSEVLSMVQWKDFKDRIEDSLNIDKHPFLVEKYWYENENTT